MMPFNYKVTPTNDTDYSCHIKTLELAKPIIWGPYLTTNH